MEAGVDEAGRGCLAGPVFAAAVILPGGFSAATLNDSKKCTPAERSLLRTVIEKEAVTFGVGSATNEEIDRMNILQASFLAMHRAIVELDPAPAHLLVDGNRFVPFGQLPHTWIVRGDSIYSSIAAASILAKTYRDEYMESLHREHPGYGWAKNKGYPTKDHRRAIHQLGPTPYHRRSFRF
jgi:ribonuclease HII